MSVKKLWFSGRIIVLSFLITILIGALLLSLPISQRHPISFVDCLFTAASSICVTGVLTIPFDFFSYFGKVIILILIQIGGVGLITLSLFLISLFRELGLAAKVLAGQALELETARHIRQVIIFITIFTLAIEVLGAIGVYFILRSEMNLGSAIFNAIFHSVSSFCSAGLSFAGDSLISYKANIPMLLITGLLIFFGTTGFTTWYELINYLRRKINKKRRSLSLTTKIVILSTIIMIAIGTIILLLLEGSRNLGNLSWPQKLVNMIFNAIAYRSTGFTTINLCYANAATILFILMYSLIGSSPGSTGGGIKITTFVIFLATVRTLLTARGDIEMKGRRIPQDQVFKALSIICLSFCWIMISTFMLLIIEQDKSFIGIFFETVSSFTTLGLATDITPCLSKLGKLLIIINMLIGRLGSLTFLLAFIRRKQERTEFQYPEERIMI